MWFQQFSELDRISHGADVVGQSFPGGGARMWERPLAELFNISFISYSISSTPLQTALNTVVAHVVEVHHSVGNEEQFFVIEKLPTLLN